ncbi:hypothetical protein OHS18_09135 [Amycolatopsis sp. NBC_00355]|uniref:hypothetical protein n=1 Tax=Amycolatopsis sp. NBC_00355 TaxID=2975957 RepID=UPI002E2547E9
MRILSAVFGALLFVAGMVLLVAGAVTALTLAGNPTSSSSDWTCSAQNSAQRCDYTVGSLPETQAEITGDLTLTVAGAGIAICGAIFVLIGSQRSSRPTAPVPPYPPAPPAPPYPPR